MGGELILNNVSTVTSANLPVTSVSFSKSPKEQLLIVRQGVVHIIDHILDPSSQLFEPDVTKTNQAFIAGSCSNPELPFC